ncbi:LptA/OstA family protein [Candidatus Margulisiibacteriota bacterium]
MDENLAWKTVFIGTIFSLIILGIAYYFISPPQSEFFTEEKMEKIAEFKDTRVSGRKEGKKTWVLFAKYGWTEKNREITYLYDVTQGEIYKDEKLVVSDLTSPWAKAYRHSEIVEAYARSEGKTEGERQLKAKINLGKISKPKSNSKEWTRFTADYLRYIPKEKRTEIKGKIEMIKRDSSIFSEKINLDNDKNIADISEDIRIIRKDGVLYAEHLKYFSDNERLEADEKVRLNIKENKVKTRIKTAHASFSTDMSKDMTFSGSLEVVQGKKAAVAHGGVYSQKKKELFMKGNARAVFAKGGVILKEKTAENLKNKEAKELLKEKTFLASQELTLSTWTGDATASGSVEVTQKGKEAKAEHAVYDDKKEIITLTGKAKMKKKDEWVNARKIIVSVKDEEFEAIGKVEAKLII